MLPFLSEEEYDEAAITAKSWIELLEQKDLEIKGYLDKIVNLIDDAASREARLCDVEADLARSNASCARLSQEAASLKEKLEKCKAELESTRNANVLNLLPMSCSISNPWVDSVEANEMAVDSHMLVPTIPAGVSGTALPASLLRDGWSLAKMYAKYQEAVDALRHEQLGRKHSQAILERAVVDLRNAKEEIEELRAEAQVNRDHMLQYKSIAQVNESVLKQIEDAHKNFKREADRVKKSLEAEISLLRDRVNELESDCSLKSKEAASAVQEEALTASLSEISSLKDELSVKTSQIVVLETQISDMKDDLEKENQRWHTAQANYARQVREMNLLRESKIQLREENKHNVNECQKLREAAQNARIGTEKLENLLAERQTEVDAHKKELDIQKMKCECLEKRVDELLERCKNIDVEDYDRMMKDFQQMHVDLGEETSTSGVDKFENLIAVFSRRKCDLVDQWLYFLNHASKEELKLVKGIGDMRATNIIENRDPEPFKTLKDFWKIELSDKLIMNWMQDLFEDVSLS